MRHARSDYDPIQDPRGLIPEDEPVFLLRGQDEVAAATVMFWANQAANIGASREIVQKARDQAQAMRVWQIEQPDHRKIPDLPA